MARLGVTIAGTIVGAYFGVPGIGAAVGGILGSILFPPEGQNTSQEGPRISDMSVTSSAYGVPLALGWGTFRIGGNVIWSPGLREHKHIDHQTTGGKGGGGSTASSTTYTYTASFAVMFGRGVLEDVLTIWADSKIIYDKTAPVAEANQNPGTQDSDGGFFNTITRAFTVGSGTTARKTGLIFRIYPGDDTQNEDPLIEADPRITEGHVPAFRGRAYIVFENLDLTDFGNRIPQISALVSYKNIDVSPYITTKTISAPGGGSLGSSSGILTLDWQRNAFYSFSVNSTTHKTYLVAYDAKTMAQKKAIDWTSEAIFPTALQSGLGDGIGMGPDGYLYTVGSTYATSGQIIQVDPLTLQPTNTRSYLPSTFSLAAYTLGFDISNQITTVMGKLGFAACYGQKGLRGVVIASAFVGDQLCAFNMGDLSLIWVDGSELDTLAGHMTPTPRIATGRICGIHQVKIASIEGETYIINESIDASSGHTVIKIAVFTVRVSYQPQALTNEILEVLDITFGVIGTVTGEDLAAAAGVASHAIDPGLVGTTVIDYSDNGVLGHCSIGNGNLVAFKWRWDTGLVWATPIVTGINQVGPEFSKSFLLGGQYAWMGGANINTLELTRGTYNTRTFGHDIGSIHQQIYVSNAGVIATIPHDQTLPTNTGYSNQLVGALIEAGGGAGATVASILTDIAAQVDLGTLDIDVTDLTGLSVSGYYIARPTTARAACQPLFDAFGIDEVETDGKLKFVRRGHASVRTLTQTELSPPTSSSNDDEWFVETRTSETDLPVRVSISFVNPANAYQQDTVTAFRVTRPVKTVHSKNEVTATIPIAWTAAEARQRAEITLYSMWAERSRRQFSTSWANIDLDPTDVITLVMDDGLTLETRLSKTTLGANWSVELEGFSTFTSAFVASAQVPAESQVPISQLIGLAAPSKLIVLDTPLLRDVDDNGGTATTVYFSAMGYSDAWRGASIYVSSDNVNFAWMVDIIVQPAWGITTNALPDNVEPFSWDTHNTLIALFSVDTGLASTTDDDVLTNFANAFAVQNADGNWEIIQAVNVTQNSDGSFTLSRLLRGRRGTDVFCMNHIAGSTIVSLRQDGSIAPVRRETGAINSTRYYKAVTHQMDVQSAQVQVVVTHGNDLKPYMPTDMEALVDGSNNINLTWIRRTRVSGELREGIGTVPLAEAEESYEVDILDGPGGIVKRTLTSSTPSATYLHANILSDLGAMPLLLTFKLYQLSVVVGRGLSREITVEVN